MICTCPNCGSPGMQIFHRAVNVPTNSCILLETRAEALAYPRGDIALGFCDVCSFVSNTAFDPTLTEYSGRYEETQGFSPTFQRFHHDLAERLIARFELNGKDILEIGCGKGEFLLLLCQGGRNRGLGFDPSYRFDRHSAAPGENVRFVKDFYSEKYADMPADFVCCKMTLEHIGATAEFLGVVRRALGETPAKVFFMIPDTTRIMKDCAFEDIYYEHCSYFSPGSLAYLFLSQGFRPLGVDTEFDGQYIAITANPASADSGVRPGGADRQGGPLGDDWLRDSSIPGVSTVSAERFASGIDSFPSAFARKLNYWRERMADNRKRGRKAVIWGSGSKGVAFLTTLGLGEEIACAVDINPHRHGYFMPGTGHRIVGPETLRELRPDQVIVMNPIYRDEIGEQLRGLGLEPELLTVAESFGDRGRR
ncbi:MAG: methyltransferase domain-containing protein [Deltaproteobacteria bacterium]|nr:MAG: methyltransferase domain-containing protein [Deltaproteobacteria bacterium]